MDVGLSKSLVSSVRSPSSTQSRAPLIMVAMSVSICMVMVWPWLQSNSSLKVIEIESPLLFWLFEDRNMIPTWVLPFEYRSRFVLNHQYLAFDVFVNYLFPHLNVLWQLLLASSGPRSLSSGCFCSDRAILFHRLQHYSAHTLVALKVLITSYYSMILLILNGDYHRLVLTGWRGKPDL